MAIQAAQPAINTLLQFGDGGSPENFSTVANVSDYAGPTMDATIVDVTSHSTGVPWRQRIPTLLSAGDIVFPLFFIPSSGGPSGGVIGHNDAAGVLKFFTDRGASSTQSGVPINMKLVFPDQAATTWSIQGFISKFTMKSPVAGVLTADMTIILTSKPTLA